MNETYPSHASHEDKLRFLIATMRILSLTTEFEKRLEEKAKPTVPLIADWCAVDVVNEDGTVKRIALVHRDPHKIELFREYEKKYPSRPNAETDTERVIRTNTPEFVPLVTEEVIDAMSGVSDEQKKDIKNLGISSLIIVPIGIGEKVLGVLTLAYAESGRLYTEEDFEFVKEFANHLSLLLENARLYTEISLRDRSKDAFLASLSHELRNPLAPIRTSLELMRLKNSDPAFRDEIDIIVHQFGHLTRLLNDLLDSTRFTQGKINITLEPIELTRIVEQVVRAVGPLSKQADLHIYLSYPPKQLHVLADRTRLEQALTNILNNAIKFTPPEGNIWVDVIEKSDTVQIRTKDSGVGITEDEIKHIFDPYYQSARIKSKNTGLGIGLFLVSQIVHLHNGTIEVKSDGLNNGSEFVITLPINATVAQIPQKNASLPSVAESKVRNILVVDDNKTAADALARLLNALGWQASAVYSASDTIVFLNKNSVDLVFLDIGMPDMTGYELVRVLKQNEKFAELPIVAVTGYGLEDDKIKAIQSGFSAHITKPIGARDLREILTGDIAA